MLLALLRLYQKNVNEKGRGDQKKKKQRVVVYYKSRDIEKCMLAEIK